MMWIAEPDGEITQGSIVDGVDWGFGNNHNPLSIVFSNACDLSHDKSSFLIVAALVSAADVFPTLRNLRI